MLVSAGQYLFSHNFIYSLFLAVLAPIAVQALPQLQHKGFSLWGLLVCGSGNLRFSSFSSCGLGALEHRCGLRCSVACGIFPVQGSNPCLPHWQANSLRLSSPGKPSLAQSFVKICLCYLAVSFSGVVVADGLLQASVLQWDADLEALEGRWPGWRKVGSEGRGEVTGVEEEMEARGGYGEKGTQAETGVTREQVTV